MRGIVPPVRQNSKARFDFVLDTVRLLGKFSQVLASLFAMVDLQGGRRVSKLVFLRRWSAPASL